MKDDRRVRKTKLAIRNALVELVETNGYDSITVTDLTKKSDLNRGTFYLHYEDKFDLLRKIEQEIFNEISCHLSNLPQRVFADNAIGESLLFYLTGSLKYISENKQLFKALLGPKGDPQFYHSLKTFMITSIFSNDHAKELLRKSDTPLGFYTDYVASAHLGVIQHWLDQTSDVTPIELAQFMTNMFVYGPKNIIKQEYDLFN